MRSYSFANRAALLLVVFVFGCSHHSPNDGGEPLDAGDGGNVTITVQPADATLAVSLGGTATKTYSAQATVGGSSTDVTAGCNWSVADATFGQFAGAVFTALPRGGVTTVTASCVGGQGSTSLTLTLSGSTVAMGAPANAPTLFQAAMPGTDPSKTPSIEYPLDQAVAPANFPPVDAQWTTAGNDLFHLNLKSKYLNVDLYTAGADEQIDPTLWTTVLESSAGNPLAFSVEGLLQAAPQTRYAGTPVSLQISTDTINNTTLYWWASSQGNLLSQVFGSSAAPSVVRGNCTACHSLSRAGTRIGYSRCVGGTCTPSTLAIGFMKSEMGTWTDTMNADDMQQLGSFTTFAPVGNPYPDDSRAVAMVATESCNLTLYDPDAAMPITSNLPTISTHDATQMPTRCASMPDWSPDGATVAFSSAKTAINFNVDLDGGAIATMTYSYAGGAHTFGEPTFIVINPITLPSGSYENFFFPSFSPDGKYIVFNAALSAWRNSTDEHIPASRLMLTSPTGAWTADLPALNGDGDYDVTWPHWAPGNSSKYYWVVFSSERDYGHLLTAANTNTACVSTGNKQCKQLWLSAIDVSKLNGEMPPTGDPSAPPIWLPGQQITADNLSPYWSVPAPIN